MKIQPTELKKIFANDATNKGLIHKIYKQLIHLNINKQKNNPSPPQRAQHLNRHSSTEDIQVENRYLKSYATWPKNKKPTKNKSWRGCGEKGTLLHHWWECKLVLPLWTMVWKFLKN